MAEEEKRGKKKKREKTNKKIRKSKDGPSFLVGRPYGGLDISPSIWWSDNMDLTDG